MTIKHTKYDPTWDGPEEFYDDHIWDQVAATGRSIKPWDQFEVLCDEPRCVLLDHIKIVAPTRLEYPSQVCTYCGVRSGTRDHLISKVWSGEAERKSVLTVPACAECNSSINDTAVHSIDGRREIAKKHIRKKYKRVLNYQILSEEELEEYGPGLQPMMRQAAEDRKVVEYRLRWPIDPTYDIRYLGKSGITDPFSNGLLDENPLNPDGHKAA